MRQSRFRRAIPGASHDAFWWLEIELIVEDLAGRYEEVAAEQLLP